MPAGANYHINSVLCAVGSGIIEWESIASIEYHLDVIRHIGTIGKAITCHIKLSSNGIIRINTDAFQHSACTHKLV